MNARRSPGILMALWSVIKDTPGVYRFQAIQTAPEQLNLRLQNKASGDEPRVWALVKRRVQGYFDIHGLGNVRLVLASEPPSPNPASGKFRHIWSEKGAIPAKEKP